MIDYNSLAAAQYGITFGNAEQNYIFERMGNDDCTNFVSECIWAGYGGTKGFDLLNPKDIIQMRHLVAENYLQTDTWFGRHYGSTSEFASFAFIRVEEFWNYCTAPKAYGPYAIGYNNHKSWQQMDVKVDQGDVLQFYHEDQGAYGHSVLVSSPTHLSISDSLQYAYVSQHSYDGSTVPLYNAFVDDLFGASFEQLKVRLLKFQPFH